MSSKLKKLNRQSIYPPPPPPPPRFFPLINKLSKTPLHGGFSLIEVLITATIGLILGAGVLKLSQVAIQNTNIVQTSLVESELKRALDKFLNDPDNPTQCQDVLGPFHASDLSASPVSVYPQTPVPTADPAKTAYEKLGKLAGETGLISIEKIELKDKSDPVRQFIVYYKKPRLGKYETIGGGRCTGGTAAGDQNGCYFVSCDIKYRCSNSVCNGAGADTDPAVTDDDDIKCALIKCEGAGKSLSDVGECEYDKHLIGFDSTGNPICRQNCYGGRTWIESVQSCGCPDGRKWNPLIRQCSSCLPNQRRKLDGSCVDACDGKGKVWNGTRCICSFTTMRTTSGDCECPKNTHGGNFGDNHPVVDPVWDDDKQRCVCPSSAPYYKYSIVAGQVAGSCLSCPKGQWKYTNPGDLGPAYCRCPYNSGMGFGSHNHCCLLSEYNPEDQGCWPISQGDWAGGSGSGDI